MTSLRVWIDQSLCTGDGLCSEIAPDVFEPRDDGLWVVKELKKNFDDLAADRVFDGRDADHPDMGNGLARVPLGQEEITIEAAEECPGECIFINTD